MENINGNRMFNKNGTLLINELSSVPNVSCDNHTYTICAGRGNCAAYGMSHIKLTFIHLQETP